MRSDSTIELVDRLDQEESRATSPNNRMYQNVGGDLQLTVEDGDAIMKTSQDYVGLEVDLAADVLRRRSKRRARWFLLVGLSMSLLIGGFVYWNRDSNNNDTHQASPNTSGGGGTNKPVTTKPHQDDSSGGDDSKVDDDTEVFTSLWPTQAPLPAFDICPPPVDQVRSNHKSPIYELSKIVIVPEADDDNDDETKKWEYTFSSMDISVEASIIAIGLSDFSSNTNWEVGMVRVFGWSCKDIEWKQLGQDLLGQNEYEEFGHRVSSSRDGQVMAVSAPQNDYDGGIGFVEVYYLNDNRWDLLGSRIEQLKRPTNSSSYYSLGHAIDLSDKGDTLAVLAIRDTNKFITRVFEFDANKQDWVRKGHDLQVTVDYDGDFDPQLALSEDGDELTMADPTAGVITYKFHFARNTWVKSDTKSASWDQDDYWIESVDMDDSGDMIAFSAFTLDGPGAVKLVDFNNDTANEVYVNSFEDIDVGIAVAVSDDGQVAAVVASKVDEDDNAFWDGDYVGALAIVSKDDADDQWKVVGKGTNAENMGVPGNFVTLSGDGQIAAVGSDTVVQLYGIALNHKLGNQTDATDDGTGKENEADNATPIFNICAPFPNATADDTHVGDLDALPKQEEEHTLSLAMSADSSVVAVGIDLYEGEKRGLARVFAWDCASGSYKQRGQDLFGSEDFDGFGQSVDLSSDGNTLVVGANQPPPGKSGYVDVYSFDDGKWKLVGHRLDNVKNSIEDVGRQVRISKDGKIVMFSGSIIEESEYGIAASFIRVVENVVGEWKSKGDDLLQSIDYDDNGAEVRVSLSGDGQTLGVTGSYSAFTAKMYTFNEAEKNWTETVIPPIQQVEEIDEDGWDCDYETYFSGADISLNDDGSVVAIAGTIWGSTEDNAIVRVLNQEIASGNWTLSHDVIDYTDDYMPSSVAISGDGQELAVGINDHSDNLEDQGALFVTTADDSDSGWKSLGKIDGRNQKDLLGSRVTISSDGKLAAASSRKGYVVFFKLG